MQLLIDDGWKECPINKILDTHDKSFFKTINGQQFELRMWDFSKYRKAMTVSWDIVARCDEFIITADLGLSLKEIDIQIRRIEAMLAALMG